MRRFFLLPWVLFLLLPGSPGAARAERGPAGGWFASPAPPVAGRSPAPVVPGEIPDRIPFFAVPPPLGHSPLGHPPLGHPPPDAAAAAVGPGRACRQAIATAEQDAGIPPRLLQAIGLVESGRTAADGTRRPWPWTVDADGTGFFFPSKAAAIAGVRRLRARGARSIDVGCQQVSLLHHPHAFASLDQAFDPAANARYAAGFLRRLFAGTHDWAAAAAAYHSQTPALAAPYRRQVMAAWSGLSASPPAAAAATATATGGAAGGGFASPFGAPVLAGLSQPRPPSTFHIMRAAPGAAAPIGRSLAAYRARPIAIDR